MAAQNRPWNPKVDPVVAEARRLQEERARGYRERALKLYPWVCGRCGRHFEGKSLRMLTVHHRDHDHDNNPPDGSNWELLCLYCHDEEHSRQQTAARGDARPALAKPGAAAALHQPFAQLKDLLRKPDDPK